MGTLAVVVVVVAVAVDVVSAVAVAVAVVVAAGKATAGKATAGMAIAGRDCLVAPVVFLELQWLLHLACLAHVPGDTRLLVHFAESCPVQTALRAAHSSKMHMIQGSPHARMQVRCYYHSRERLLGCCCGNTDHAAYQNLLKGKSRS